MPTWQLASYRATEVALCMKTREVAGAKGDYAVVQSFGREVGDGCRCQFSRPLGVFG